MRKLLHALCLLMVCVLIPSAAMAMTQTEWDHECRSKTKGTTTLYTKGEGGDLTAIGSLPDGTYIKLGTYDYDLRMWDIAYWSSSSRASAWVMRDNVTAAETMVHFSDGTSVSLPEALVSDTSALQAYIRRQYPGKTLNGSNSDSPGKTESSESSGTSNGSSTKPRGHQSAAPSGLTATLEGSIVAISQLGVYQSCVIIDGEEAIVLTADLIFAEDVPSDKAIAVIYAPNTGKCTLRQKASDSAKALGKCKAGAIVAVLEYGRKYCKISCDGEVGYVLTSCLKFYGEADAPAGTGTLTWNGKATGRTKINIRNAADSDAHKIAEWRTGTEVAVFGKNGKWYEIEHEGMHGFVHENYLTIGE